MVKLFGKIASLAALAALVSAPSVLGVQVGIDRVTGYYAGNGGEFTITGLSTWDYAPVARATGFYGEGFQSFCMELDESLSIPNLYTATINDRTIAGGAENTGPDPVSLGTAYLYSQFAQGVLSGYNYTVPRSTSAGQLQQAIWALENEIAWITDGSNPFINSVLTEFGTETGAKADANGAYNVYVLNITSGNGLRQDQLWYHVPDGGSTLALLGFGLLGVSAYGRKSRK